MTTQIKPLNLSNQNTNTSYNNMMDTQPANGEDCQCEMEETNKPLLPFQSNFARQLHENEVMRRRRPPINTTSQQIEARQQNTLQYTGPPVIEHNPETLQQALPNNQTSRQMEWNQERQRDLPYNQTSQQLEWNQGR